MFAKFFVVASLSVTALALPNITAKALPAGCASYPLYDESTGNAGPWGLSAANSDNPLLENFGVSNVYSVSYSPSTGPVMRWGYNTLNFRGAIALRAHQCIDDKLTTFTPTTLNSAGAPINPVWTPLALSPYPYDASLLYLVDGEQPTLYEHYAGDVKQAGYFLGGYNTTTWGVKWYEASQGSWNLPYFYLRLLPEGQALKANETKTFIRIQA
ncbi:hypothetical protein ACN47E_001831 [Coniothyrium glycines]